VVDEPVGAQRAGANLQGRGAAPRPRGSDGTLTDGCGFGSGNFTLRPSGFDGQQITDSFAGPAAGIAGQTLTGQGNSSRISHQRRAPQATSARRCQ
jgi:hypothetical protein